MLQPRESRLLWRRRKRRHGLEGLFYSKLYNYTLIVIGCLTLLPQGLTQHNDEIYIVKPTPALRLDKEELTTVLLVNNENHGRFINVRPEVGLLTSTARTFIQEGVTTEYATQVVGTTLDNGRVYAQYLKKSSRVLYDSGVPVPSVITSWVGESSLHSDSPGFLPQSHNDLFNADQPDWQAIDDRLLVDRRHHDDFVGNTDYVGLRRKPVLATSSLGAAKIVSVGTPSKPVYNFVTQLGVLEESARKVAANKVLPIGDLPTYTIKQNYEPSAYLSSNHDDIVEGEDIDDDSFGRNPKLIYKKLMQSAGRSESEKESPAKPFIPVTRHLATVTYYGFADFTTVVGDSVIVFSPSTSTNNVNYKAQVTSIKGEATLAVGLPQGPNISKVPITIAQDLIEPTITQQPSIETSLETGSITMQVEPSQEESTSSFTTTTSTSSAIEHSSDKSILMDIESISLLPTSEVLATSMVSELSSVEANSIESPVMLSRPSDEEILRIYNALANANKDIDKIKIEPTTATDTTIVTETETSKDVDVPHLETSNVQIFGGATTIFFEDDPFANFVEPVKTSTILESTISAQNTSSSNVLSDSTMSSTVSSVDSNESVEESLSTSAKTTEVITQDIKIIETTTTDQSSLITSEIILDATVTETPLKGETKQSSQDIIHSSDILSNVLIKEIDPNMDEVPVDCISTSQVFLTQLPKTVTNFETVVTTINESELKTEILQKIQPTFEIKEATKYYCIQASKIHSTAVNEIGLSSAVNTAEEKEDRQQQPSIAEVTEMSEDEGKTEAAVVLNTTEETLLDLTTERPDVEENKNQDITEHSGLGTTDDETDEEEQEEPEDEEASGHSEEDDEDDEEIELIYKTLYTTYTYLTTFFHDESTSISSHTEVVTNVMTSTLGISSTKESLATNLVANLNDNEINPTISSLEMETTKRFVVPSEVESLIRTDEHMQSEIEADLEPSKSSESLATFYTTYTYYTTIFAEGETDIMSHTEVITNIKKSTTSASLEADKIMPTLIPYQKMQEQKDEIVEAENIINYKSFSEAENSSISSSATIAANDVAILPNIPDLGDLAAITLVTDVRSSSSPGEKQIINNMEAQQKISNDKVSQQPSVLEDQISSESNTDTDEIIPSATLLLQTSFTTFTYYTTMYSGDKTNVISRLETMTNTVTETLQPSKTIDLEGASVPITYFTTFTYWTKLAREGQITTLSREETISNIIIPTMVQSQLESVDFTTEKTTDIVTVTEASVTDETTLPVPKEKNENMLVELAETEITTNSSSSQYTTNLLEPTTYYTTYTYYTTSYEVDKTITDSRFETVTNIITPTVTLSNTGEWESTLSTPPPLETESNNEDKSSANSVILYDFKKIIDADGISTIFFTTEIKPSINSDGITTEIISSTSSLLINEEKRRIQATESSESSAPSLGLDGQTQKQYKTGLVRLIEGTRISNRTTTLYQSKVIGTVIDQRYAQIIESTSSFIFEKTKAPTVPEINPTSTTIDNQNIPATQQVELTISSLMPNVEGSIIDTTEQETETTIKPETDIEIADEENYSKTDEKLRFPFQTKKPGFISPLKPFSNRNRPQFAPKKNSSATIITRSDFTPTITATPALKTINRFSSSRRGSANGGIASSNSVSLGSSTRRFGRPNKQSSVAAGLSNASTLGSTASRNRYASSSSSRGSFAGSSSRRVGNSASTIRPSFSRPSLFSTGFPNNSRLRVRPTAITDLGDISSPLDASTTNPSNSQEEGAGDSLDQNDSLDDEEENTTTESNRRQNNPLLRLRRPLNRPQGFTPARTQQNANSPNNSGVTLRRNPLIARSRSNSNAASLTTSTTTTTTNKPKARTYQPLLTQNRLRPTNSLFPPRNIFGVQKQAVTTEENKDLSEEDTNENNENDDSEYEDDDDDEEDSENDDEDEVKRRRRSHNKTDAKEKLKKNRKKREADSNQQNRSNFRQRFRRPKLATHQAVQQVEPKSNEEDVSEAKEVPATTQRTRSRFGARYSGHSSSASSTTSATTSAATSSSNHKVAIRPTRPTANNGRAQFTLREKDSSQTSTTQKVITSAKRPAFRRPQPGSGSVSTRRLPSSTSPSASTSSSGKRRLKSFNNQDSTTTSRNSVTGRNRASSSASGRSRSSSGSSRDSNISGRSRPRNNHNYNSNNNNNNNNEALVIDNSGTITVTHVVPAEVTIPVVNGKITEYKQVVTAKTSTEVLGPQQYTTTIGNNGLTQLALTREDSSVNYNGATEITQYILHETPTTTITFTPTTIRGRKTSFSHVLPSTVYSVEQVVSTQQPQISANAPLANILLSQLLLGNVGLPAANPLLGALGGALTQPGVVGPPQPATPVTEYKTHASTYVTTVFEGQSTVLPITFQGKKILTTIFDTTAQTITATEFITDTIVTTPTIAQQQPVVNSLLLQQLLLQQHLQQQQIQQPTPDPTYPLNAILNSVPPQFLLSGDNLQELEASNNIRGSGHGDILLNEDDDFSVGSSSVDLDDIALQAQAQTHKSGRKKTRKNGKSHKRKQNNADSHPPNESSVITLYVSGRRPGEFSTVLSTVQIRPDSTLYKRHAHTIDSDTDYLNEGSELVNEYWALPPKIVLLDGKDKNENELTYETKPDETATQSLESIVGDVSLWYNTQISAATTNTAKLSISSTETIDQKSSPDSHIQDIPVNSTSQEPKQFEHFDSGQEEPKADTFIQPDSTTLKTSYDYRYDVDNNDNSNEQSKSDDIDEARYNLATRIMSNGVEVIIAGDKTKTPDHIIPDFSNSQMQQYSNKPMTLAASTIKNQMMILLFPSSITAADENIVVNGSIQQLNFNLPFHTNHFITKTCLTTYTYRTTYVQDGRTTVESREKVISNIATEERNYPKISPSQTIGVTLTRTPELAVGIFPTTYSYFNTIQDNNNNLQVMTSEHTVVNTITGPHDYLAYLQPPTKATPNLKTNTYFNEVTVTLSQKFKSKLQTLKRNLTQVVVTKSYMPSQSTSVLTSYYAYDNDSEDKFNTNSNLSTDDSLFPNEETSEYESNEDHHIDKTKILNDIHIYATKTFLTTFTYYTTTVLNSYVKTGTSQTDVSIKPMSTVFNYYTRVIENVITDSVPATLLNNELLAKMKMELKRQKHNQQRHRVIVTTATLKDGQTIRISAMEMYKSNLPSAAPTLSTVNTLNHDSVQHTEEAIEEYQTQSQSEIDVNDDFQLEESSSSGNIPPETDKHPENLVNSAEENNVIASLPSEQILSIVKAPNNQTIIPTNVKISPTLNGGGDQTTSAANQLIQRLTALKPMFNAMADMLQNNFGGNRETIKPIKNIESKQSSNKKINSTADTTTTHQHIYIPVQKSPIKNHYNEISNYSDFIPQSLHIKPPLLLSDDEDKAHFNLNDQKTPTQDKHTNIIPLATLTAPRQEQPLHNGGIYIRPGEIITANSDVIVGKPNGIEYAQVPNHLHNDKNTSKAYTLDNRQFQVTYYHNKIQHPYKKITSSVNHRPHHIPIGNGLSGVNGNKLNQQPTFGMRPPNEQHFNTNILKPPPPPTPTHQSPIPLHTKPGLSLMLTAPDKSRTRNKHLPTESTSALHSHLLASSSRHKITDHVSQNFPATTIRGPQHMYRFNNDLKNNEILEIQQIPQVFSADLKPSALPNTNLAKATTNTNGKLKTNIDNYEKNPSSLENYQNSASNSNWQSDRGAQTQTSGTYLRLQPENFSSLSVGSIWQNGQETQTKTVTALLSHEHKKEQGTNFGTIEKKSKPENSIPSSSLNWNPQPERHHIKLENPLSLIQYPTTLTSHNHKNQGANYVFENPVLSSSVIWNLQQEREPQIKDKFLSSHVKQEHPISLLIYPQQGTLGTNQQNSRDSHITTTKGSLSYNTPPSPKPNVAYTNESLTKKHHQKVSLDQHIFSQTVDVNVPPLTFNRDDLDYPQLAGTAVKGQIPPASVKEMKSQEKPTYKYMPLITIPANEQQVHVSLTPLNTIGAFTSPIVVPKNEPSWNHVDVAGNDYNNIVSKMSLPKDNFKMLTTNDQVIQDQKTFATSNVLSIKPTQEATAVLKHKTSTNQHNNKPMPPPTIRPDDTTRRHLKSTLKPNRLHQPTKVSTYAHINTKSTTHPLVEVPLDLRYPPHTHPTAELSTVVSQTQPQHYIKSNNSHWILSEDHNREKELKHNFSSKVQHSLTNDVAFSRIKPRVSIQKTQPFGIKTNKTPTLSSPTTEVSQTVLTEPKAKEINEIMSSAKSENGTLQASQIVNQGEPFRKPTNYQLDNNIRQNQSKIDAIFVAPGEAFRRQTNKQNLINKIYTTTTSKPEITLIKETSEIETNLSPKEIFVTRESQYTAHKQLTINPLKMFDQTLANTTVPTTTKTITATTETVFGLQPPPLITSPTTSTKTASKKISLTTPEVTRIRQPSKSGNITPQPTNNNTDITSAFTIAKNKEILMVPDKMKLNENNRRKTASNVNIIFKPQNETNLKLPKDNDTLTTYFENESRKSNDGFKFIHLLPSETYKEKTSTTTTPSPLISSILTFTTTTTTTIKRIILPTKYITNKHIYTVTTTATRAEPAINQQPTTYLLPSTIETTTEVSTLFLTHTEINTIVDTVTSVKTLEPVTITATTTLTPTTQPSSSIVNPNLSNFNQFSSSTYEINHNLTYLPYPSVEVVPANATQQEAALNPNENSIFIIMTNNKNKKNTVLTQPPHQNHHNTISEIGNTIPMQLSEDNDIAPIDETNEVMIEYDNGISFDDTLPIRDEEPPQIINGNSVNNNVATVKESSDDHIILGGVLIATPPKSPLEHINQNESANLGCLPKCKASRNEQCVLVDNHWNCLCRPGFARMFPDRPCKPTYTYALLMHAERVGNYSLQYVSELRDNKTEHYKQLSQLVNNALDRMIMQSDFRDAYHGVQVTQFEDDYKSHHGILINVLMQLSDNSNEKRLEEVFKKNLRVSNYSIGGTDLYTNKAGVDALAIKDFNECLSRKLHDCSENAHCFNLPGTYTCSCVEGFADLSDNPIYPGRVCSSEQIGCEMCHYHGKCFYYSATVQANSIDRNYCECFPWYAGSKCQVNLKILLIVLLGIGTLLFILLLFCVLITCTKRRSHLQHTALAPSTMTSSSEGLPKNSRLTSNMLITGVGLQSSVRDVSLKNNKRQKSIKIDKRSMIKDSSSEISQNSLPYVLKNRESNSGSCNKKKICLNNSKTYRNYSSQGNSMEQYSTSATKNVQIENQSDLNTIITSSSSFKGKNQQIDKQNLLGNTTEYEGHYCEQSDRSLTVMIPRAKYHSSVLSQTQLMHHQLTMERVYKTAKPKNKLINNEKDSTEMKRNYKKNLTTREVADEEKHIEIPSNPGALISAGFEVSAIVKDNATIVNSMDHQNNDLVNFDSIPPNYTIITTSDPATSLDSNSDQKHLLNDDRQQLTCTKKFSTNESDYNVYKCEKDLIETMDEWLGNVKLNELSAEARSFDETTIRASKKPLRVSVDGTQTLHDEVNTMAERDLGSTFLLPHTHLYKPERQESELSGFDSF